MLFRHHSSELPAGIDSLIAKLRVPTKLVKLLSSSSAEKRLGAVLSLCATEFFCAANSGYAGVRLVVSHIEYYTVHNVGKIAFAS